MPKILITCYEIKVSVSDFRSEHGHNFIGNHNFYVVPKDIFKQIKNEVPKDIGIIVYDKGSLRRVKNCEFKEMTDEEQKWLILSALKRVWRG